MALILRARSRRVFAHGLALTALALLPGCKGGDSTSLALNELMGAKSFATATREELSGNEYGTRVRLQIVSTAPASWMDADRAMFEDLAYQCRDGASYSPESESPMGFGGGMAAMELRHPAGTTFTRVVTCSAPPRFEFALAEGTSETEAMAQVWAKLGSAPTVDPGPLTVRVVTYNDRNRKYPAIATAVGHALAGRMTQCPNGMRVNRLIVAAHPTPADTGQPSLHSSYVVLGVDAPCQDADTAAVAP